MRSGGTDPGDWLVTAFLLGILVLAVVIIMWTLTQPDGTPFP